MAKLLFEQPKLVDIVEVLDARIPISSANPDVITGLEINQGL